MLTFKLTAEQKAGLPDYVRIKDLAFRKSVERVNPRYCRVKARAEYQSREKKRTVSAATKMIGIIWDDDPEWLYESDKRKSPYKERRVQAFAAQARKSGSSLQAPSHDELFDYAIEHSVLESTPIEPFVLTALRCAARGVTDCQALAEAWNAQLTQQGDGCELNAQAVRRLFASLTPQAVESVAGYMHDVMPVHATLHPRIAMRLCALDVMVGTHCVAHTTVRTDPDTAPCLMRMLEYLSLETVTCTAPAPIASSELAASIIAQGGHYILPVTEHQPVLLAYLQAFFDDDAAENEQRCALLPASCLPESVLKSWKGLSEGCLVRVRAPDCQDHTLWFIASHPYSTATQLMLWLHACVRCHCRQSQEDWSLEMVWLQEAWQSKHPNSLRVQETIWELAQARGARALRRSSGRPHEPVIANSI